MKFLPFNLGKAFKKIKMKKLKVKKLPRKKSESQFDIHIDVWHGEGIMHEGCIPNVATGKKIMKELYKEGKDQIRMYYDNDRLGTRWYYSFDKNGNIFKENNNLDN